MLGPSLSLFPARTRPWPPLLALPMAVARPLLALLNYPFYPLFILDNGMNSISKSLIVLTSA